MKDSIQITLAGTLRFGTSYTGAIVVEESAHLDHGAYLYIAAQYADGVREQSYVHLSKAEVKLLIAALQKTVGIRPAAKRTQATKSKPKTKRGGR